MSDDLVTRGFSHADESSRAAVTRRLLDAGHSPIEAHTAVSQGRAAEILSSQLVTHSEISSP